MEKFDVSLNHLQTGRSMIETSKSIERIGQNKNRKIEFQPYPSNAESNFTPVEFCTLTNTRLLQDEHFPRSVGAFPANNFIFNAGVTDFVAISDEKFPDSFGGESLFSGMFEVGLKILVDLLADGIGEDARGLNDLPILGQDLISQSILYIFDLMHVLFRCVPGDAQFAGYSFVGLMQFVQIHDSTYICHRFHLSAHLSECLEREGFPSWGGQKRIGVSLNSGVKNESAKTVIRLAYQSLAYVDGKRKWQDEINFFIGHLFDIVLAVKSAIQNE